jgi:hypothetical protein
VNPRSPSTCAVFDYAAETWLVEAKAEWTAGTVQRGLGQLLLYEQLAREGDLQLRRGGADLQSPGAWEMQGRGEAWEALNRSDLALQKVLLFGTPVSELEDAYPMPDSIVSLCPGYGIRIFAVAEVGPGAGFVEVD